MENLEEYQKKLYAKARKDEQRKKAFGPFYIGYIASAVILLIAIFYNFFEIELLHERYFENAALSVYAISVLILIRALFPFGKVSEEKLSARYQKILSEREEKLRLSCIDAHQEFENALFKRDEKLAEYNQELRLIEGIKRKEVVENYS